jgi:hypothetical protein
MLESPEQDVTAYVVVIEGDNFEEAAESAWGLVDPDFEGQPNVLERPCQGCTSAGADKFALIPFDTGDEQEFVLGAGWIYDGQTYMTLWVTDQATIEKKGDMVNTVLIGFKITALEAAEGIERPTPEPSDETETGGEITLVPFNSESFGIRGLVPEGWTEISPGIHARGSSAADETVVLQQAAPVSAEELLNLLMEQLGVSEALESSGEREANSLTWQIYSLETEGVNRDVALAQGDGIAFIVVLRSDAIEHDELYEAIFLPVVDALVLVD